MSFHLSIIILFFSLSSYANFNLPAVIKHADYYHFEIDEQTKKNLNKNDQIILTIENLEEKSFLFYLVFEDNQSHDYWSKLNLKTTLFPGINVVSFDLKEMVGEKGSKRDQRNINYLQLKKMFAVFDPDTSTKTNAMVKIKKIDLKKMQIVKLPSSLKAYKFQPTQFKNDIPKFFTIVNENQIWNKKSIFGFTEPKFYRNHDAGIKPSYLSSTIGIKSGSFSVRLSKGTYQFQLNWNAMGYWDVPFWNRRELFVNGKSVIIEKRNTFMDYLKSYSKFMVEVPWNDHIYDFYFKNIFKPVMGEFVVKNKEVEFTFEADATGVELNTLFIWPKSINQKAQNFFNELDQFNKSEVDKAYRLNPHVFTKMSQVELHLQDNLNSLSCVNQNTFSLVTAPNGFKEIDFCINMPNTNPYKISITDLSSKENVIKSEAIQFKTYEYRYKSIDLNHETYSLDIETLTEYNPQKISYNYPTRFYHLNIIGGAYLPGEYQGQLNVIQNDKTYSFPFKVTILNQKLSPVDFQFGFIGLSPITSTYFESNDSKAFINNSYIDSYESLKDIGLSLFTDFPAPTLSYKKPSYDNFQIDDAASKKFLQNVTSNAIFSYTGDFPRSFFKDNFRHSAQTEEKYWDNMTRELKRFIERYPKKEFIYLYSDEPTGYRNAVDIDTDSLKKFKKIAPFIKYGGFANPYDLEKGKELFNQWDYAFYSDIPNQTWLSKIPKSQNFGVYNICAERRYDLAFCFGLMAYRLHKLGVKYYLEWHASAIHNYPGFDLDGRETDNALFYFNSLGDLLTTKRYIQAAKGVDFFRKLAKLDQYLSKLNSLNEKQKLAKVWLDQILGLELYPLKQFYDKNYPQYKQISSKLDEFMKTFFI